MYAKYTTDAIILKEVERGEYDKMFALYTRDFGLVQARAQSVRAMKSRMRAALTLFAPASVSLVRGSQGWRIAGVRTSVHEALSYEGAHAYSRIVQLVVRLVHGEEPNQYLYETLLGARTAFAAENRTVVASAELLCVARILYSLGYLSPQALTVALFIHAQYGEEELQVVSEMKKDMIVTVNKALTETHL